MLNNCQQNLITSTSKELRCGLFFCKHLTIFPKEKFYQYTISENKTEYHPTAFKTMFSTQSCSVASATTLWLLWAFSAWQIVMGVLSLTSIVGDRPCETMYGRPCNPAESVYQNYNALWKLHTGVLVGSLTWASSSSHSSTTRGTGNDINGKNLPQHAVVWILVADLTGVTLFGHENLNGIMTDTFHLLSMILQFLMLAIALVNFDLSSAHVHPGHSLPGLSLKRVYLYLITIYFGLWFLLNSDGSEPSEVVLDADIYFTPLATHLWNWWSVAILQLMFVNIWTLRFGSNDQQKALCISNAGLQVVDMIVIFLLREYETWDILIKTNTSFSIMFVLAIVAVHLDNKKEHEFVGVKVN